MYKGCEARGLTNDPVGQPLLVITRLGRLQSPTREVGRQRPSDEVGNRLSQAKQVEQDQHGGRRTETQDTVRLGDVGTGLEFVQETILGQLPVQGVELSLGNLLGLLDERVVCGGIGELGYLLTSGGGESSTGFLGIGEGFVGLGLDGTSGFSCSVGSGCGGISGSVSSVGSGVPSLVGSVGCSVSGSVRGVLGLRSSVVGRIGSFVSCIISGVRSPVRCVVGCGTDVVRSVVSLVRCIVYRDTGSVGSIVYRFTGTVGSLLTRLLCSDGRIMTRLVRSLSRVGVGEVVCGVGSSVDGLVGPLRAGVDVGVGLCRHFLREEEIRRQGRKKRGDRYSR